MSGDLLRRAEEIYFSVSELAPGDRAAAVARACAGDAVLKAEVESLLQHTDGVGGFLATPVLGESFSLSPASEGTPGDDMVGQTIGHYRVDRRLASGGMGTVYQASRADAQFTQRVALKVVKRGMDSEEIVRRFRKERQTLAALNHPNIARLIDGGITPDGRPYLVMEFVEGVPLDTYCTEHPLTLTARLRLFESICDAVAYAHRSLIVHRDLKPSNILVTPEGVPKLVDFGISSVLVREGTAEVTSADERRLTPEYASPEQVRGQAVSTATDVYSLGVILFELLTGARPYSFVTRSTQELERLICTLEPAPPSVAASRARPAASSGPQIPPPAEISVDRLRRKLEDDLDNIALMALRKEPERRYATVEQFAGDIRRFSGNLPVLARRDTLSYRAHKFVLRNALACVFAGAISVSIVAGVVGIVWQWRVADSERDAAYLARDQSEALSRFLQKMLDEADPARAGPDATLRDWVDTTAASLDGQLRDRPLVLAAVRAAIGRMYLALGLTEKAEAELSAALDARTRLLPPGHHDIAESKDDIATLRYDQGRLDEAEQLLRSALNMHERLRGHDNADTAEVLNDLGAVLRAAGKLDEAEVIHRRALAVRTGMLGPQSLEVAESLNNIAGIFRARGRKEEGLAKSASDPAVQTQHLTARTEQMAEAERLAAESLAIRRAVLKENHPLVAQALQNLAVMKAEREDYAPALELMQQALKSYEGIFGDSHPAVIRALGNVSFILKRQGRLEDAESPLRLALQSAQKRFPPTDPLVLSVELQLARLLEARGLDADAEQLFLTVDRYSTGESRAVQTKKDAVAALHDLYLKMGRSEDAARYAPNSPAAPK